MSGLTVVGRRLRWVSMWTHLNRRLSKLHLHRSSSLVWWLCYHVLLNILFAEECFESVKQFIPSRQIRSVLWMMVWVYVSTATLGLLAVDTHWIGVRLVSELR